MNSDYCVDATCRQAVRLGYDVILVADAHSTLDNEHLKAQQIVAHPNLLLNNIESKQGRLLVVETKNVAYT